MRRCHRSCAAALARGRAVARKIPNRAAICAHGRDDTERRTPPRSPGQSWATSRCRYPDRKLPDRCPEYRLTVAAASLSSPMAGGQLLSPHPTPDAPDRASHAANRHRSPAPPRGPNRNGRDIPGLPYPGREIPSRSRTSTSSRAPSGNLRSPAGSDSSQESRALLGRARLQAYPHPGRFLRQSMQLPSCYPPLSCCVAFGNLVGLAHFGGLIWPTLETRALLLNLAGPPSQLSDSNQNARPGISCWLHI